MNNAQTLANKLYELRKTAGFSQEELAEKLQVSRQAISKWERGEALPDTDNLISIAKLYGVSLDELIGNDAVKNEKENANTDDMNFDNEDKTTDENKSGIHVNIDDGDEKVKVDIDTSGVQVKIKDFSDDFDDDDDDDDDDDGEIYYSYTTQSTSKKQTFLRLLHNLPYPIIVTIAFLLWGFLGGAWFVSWTLFLTIPVYYSIIDCFRVKKVSRFVYPVFITFVYCFIGMQWALWHPYWILYLTIPIFYPIASAIDKR